MKIRQVIPVFLLTLLVQPLLTRAADPPLIRTILQGTAAYCQRLEHAAFRFTCLEKVKQKSRRSGHRFVYDYQLVKEKDTIEERRILTKLNGKPVRSPQAALNQRFSAELFSYRAALAPIYLFGARYRNRFRFVITGKRRMQGRPTWEVTIFRRPDSPLPAPLEIRKKRNHAVLGPIQGEPRVVTAWVDRQNYAIIGFQVYPAGISGYNKIVKAAFRRGRKVKVKDIHIFGLQREGIRYPTRTQITLEYSPINPGAAPLIQQYGHVPGVSTALKHITGGRTGSSNLKISTVFTYTGHRFFTARSADPAFPDME